MRRWLLGLSYAAALMACGLRAEAAGRDGALIDAVKAGDAAAVKTALRGRPSINAPDQSGATALHWAVQNNHEEVVALLLRAGADAKAANRYGVRPLTIACMNGDARVVGHLLTAGADPNAALSNGETPLMTAARNGSAAVLKLLVAHGAKVNAREPMRGQTPLMWAAAEGRTSAISALVEAGAEVSAQSNLQRVGGRLDAYGRLIDEPVQTATDRIPELVGRGNRGVLNILGTSTGFTPLLFAVRNGHIGAVRALLQAGASANEASAEGTSALILAIINAHWELASFLMDSGADVTASQRGFTALHQLAASRRPNLGHLPHPVPTGHVDSLSLARALIARGAPIEARMTKPTFGDGYRSRFNYMGSTPFMVAAKRVDVELMRLLVRAGADPRVPNAERTTPLMAAAGVGLFNPGEDPGTEAEVLEAVTLCLELGMDVNAVDRNGETALHGAAYRNHPQVLALLARKGARTFDAKNTIGWTPLTISRGVMYSDVYKAFPDTAVLIAQLMKERGFAVESTSVDITGAGYLKDVQAEPEKIAPAPTPPASKP